MSSERPDSQTQEAEPFLYISDGNVRDAANGDTSSAAFQIGSLGGKSAKQAEKEAFERGLGEGQALARADCEKRIKSIAAAISAALEKFKSERETYFAKIEPEVVQLALAIARKILHREAQMDPLLLAGMVHVALEKADAATRVRLRTNPLDIHFWNEYFAQSASVQPAPELIGDASLQPGECSLETELGSTQISLETHLKEIEQGFFDLLEQRPRVR